jgi:hypothetical protein
MTYFLAYIFMALSCVAVSVYCLDRGHNWAAFGFGFLAMCCIPSVKLKD